MRDGLQPGRHQPECIVFTLKTNYHKNSSNLNCEAETHIYEHQLIGALTQCHLSVRNNIEFMITTKHTLIIMAVQQKRKYQTTQSPTNYKRTIRTSSDTEARVQSEYASSSTTRLPLIFPSHDTVMYHTYLIHKILTKIKEACLPPVGALIRHGMQPSKLTKTVVKQAQDSTQELDQEVKEEIRLGKYSEGGRRPMKVRIRSQVAVEEIMARKGKVANDTEHKYIWIKRDMNLEEREKEKVLRSETKGKKQETDRDREEFLHEGSGYETKEVVPTKERGGHRGGKKLRDL
ncbi:hypothetical protein E2C01_031621 [Portunus trituberculatus]|uniref:Uncharacterized protein n=1 Tax=Portunus trituberculatus TaxID=210409 RepID=A0A5B7EYL5_PORTR|nr:hypothetical protein [Portunus trituberculatus]